MSDVLHSVKKMEESLKRLKQARKTASATPSGSSGGGMSDDDKIRLQLALDVEYLGEQVTNRLLSSVPGTLRTDSEGRLVVHMSPEMPLRSLGRLFPHARKRGQGPKILEGKYLHLGTGRKKR